MQCENINVGFNTKADKVFVKKLDYFWWTGLIYWLIS